MAKAVESCGCMKLGVVSVDMFYILCGFEFETSKFSCVVVTHHRTSDALCVSVYKDKMRGMEFRASNKLLDNHLFTSDNFKSLGNNIGIENIQSRLADP